MVHNLVPVDPAVAAALFDRDLQQFWATGRPHAQGWELQCPTPLRAVVTMPAVRSSGERDKYFVQLAGTYYSTWPPLVIFITPDGTEVLGESRWIPSINNPGWIAIHPSFDYAGGKKAQLVCYSLNAAYYMTDHSPSPSQVWQQGHHTLAASLTRLQEVLQPPHYRGPSKTS